MPKAGSTVSAVNFLTSDKPPVSRLRLELLNVQQQLPFPGGRLRLQQGLKLVHEALR